MQNRTALIVGTTGMVGKELLQILLEADMYKRVIALVRRPLHIEHPKLVVKVVNFVEIENWKKHLYADDIYCCLGTTIKKAKTKEAMYAIDVEYPLSIARLCFENGGKHFLVISSMNANKSSPFFYPKMKGELEQKLVNIPYRSISILRPSLLLGERDEFRLGESVASAVFPLFSWIFKGPFRKYQAIEGKKVALSMLRIAQANKEGYTIYESHELEEIANE